MIEVLRSLVKWYSRVEGEAGNLDPVSNAILTGTFHGLVSFGITMAFADWRIAPAAYAFRELDQLVRDFGADRMDSVPWYDRVGDVVGAVLGTVTALVVRM